MLYKSLSRRPGFTLVELLTVIAIIGVLTAILIPAVGKMQHSARSADCIGKLRQWGVTIALYSQENNGEVPNPWLQPLERYGNDEPISWTNVLVSKGLISADEALELMRCPNTDTVAGPGTTCYGMSQKLCNWDQDVWYPARILNPSNTIILGDVGINETWGYQGQGSGGVAVSYNGSRETDRLDYREAGNTTNILFADGHVASLVESEVTRQMFEPYKIVND